MNQHPLVNAYIGNLETVRREAAKGNPAAQAKAAEVKRDPNARVLYDALDLHARLHRGDPRACAVVREMVRRARLGDAKAKTALSAMQTCEAHATSSLVPTSGAGAAKFGGYGMPTRTRAGVVFGGATPTQIAELAVLIDRAILSRPVLLNLAQNQALAPGQRNPSLSPYRDAVLSSTGTATALSSSASLKSLVSSAMHRRV